MSPSRICPTLRDSAARALRVLPCLALLIALVGAVPPAVSAEGIQVGDLSATYSFSESLTFEAQFAAGAPLSEAIVFFGRAGYPLVRRAYAAVPSGPRGTVQYVENLEQGQFAPGTLFRYWWEFTAADGSTAVTPERTLEYTDRRFEWQVLPGDRVDLHYYGTARQAGTLLEAAEEAIQRLEADLGVPEVGRVSIYSYQSARDMALALTPRSEVYDDRVLTLGVAIDERTLLLLGTHRDARQTVAHELSHIVVGQATDNPFTTLPRWLDEGLAMHAEGALPVANRNALESAVRSDSLISLRSMTSYTGQAGDVDLFYGQAYSVVDYMLAEFGQGKMRELLSVFAEGVRQDEALQRTFGFGLDHLEDLWRESLGLQPRARPTPVCTSTAPAPRTF